MRKQPEKENISVKKCIFPFFGCQNLGVYASMPWWKSHSLQRGSKSHLGKQSHLKSQSPPEMTLLKSQQNLQFRIKSNYQFISISNICFRKFSRWLELRVGRLLLIGICWYQWTNRRFVHSHLFIHSHKGGLTIDLIFKPPLVRIYEQIRQLNLKLHLRLHLKPKITSKIYSKSSNSN